MSRRYLEDFTPGDTIQLGHYRFTQEEIVEFATRFDPQPFHVDEEAAKQSIYGGLIASGWHTISATMRLMVDGFVNGTASLGSPGIDEIRFLKPVRPGDVITARGEILEVVPSRSKADRGHMITRYEVSNQRGEVVLTMIGRGIYARRPSGDRP